MLSLVKAPLGSIRPAWMLRLEILDVDWTLIGPLGMLWGTDYNLDKTAWVYA